MIERNEKIHAGSLIFYFLPTLFLLLIYFIPLADVFRISFYNAHTVGGIFNFVWFNNFIEIFNSRVKQAMLNTLIYVFGSFPFTITLSIIFAIILNKKFLGRGIFRALVFLPWAIPNSISAIIFRWFLHSEYGLLNHLLLNVGLINKPIEFFSINIVMLSNIFLQIWKNLSFATISILAGLQSIDEEIYEAARIDGANYFQQLINIILPLLRNTIVATSLILIIWAFVTFELIWVLTGGGPLGASETLPLSIYRLGFQSYNAGAASALSVISLLIIIPIVVIIFKLGERNNND